MSASGDFNPPDLGGGAQPGPPGRGPRPRGVPLPVAFGILAVVLVLGLAAIFAFGRPGSSGTTPFALQGATPSVGLPPRDSSGTGPAGPGTAGLGSVPVGPDSTAPAAGTAGTAAAGTPAGSGSTAPGGSSTGGAPAAGGSADAGVDPDPGPAFRVGECVDTSGSGSHFDVVQTSCSSADYKIIYAFQNETGNVTNDQSQCYSVNGTDDEFENGGSGTGYTLYCMNSLTGDYSPRRADVDNCLDAEGEFEVDCTSSRAMWIVIGRLDGTTNTKGCTQFGSYDYSYYWSMSPPFVLCVDKYRH